MNRRLLRLWAATLALGCLSGCAWLQNTSVVYRLPATGEPRFHVVGVYRGDAPLDVPGSLEYDGCFNFFDPDCMPTFMHQTVYTVDVLLTDKGGPVTLGLSAYDRTEWHLRLAPGVDLKRVILSGRYPQTITGIPAGIEVDIHTDVASDCTFCRTLPGDFRYFDLFNYRQPAALYAHFVTIPVTSFQGAFQLGDFTVPPHRK